MIINYYKLKKIKFQKIKKLLLISKSFSLKILLQNLKFHSYRNKFKFKNRKTKKQKNKLIQIPKDLKIIK